DRRNAALVEVRQPRPRAAHADAHLADRLGGEHAIRRQRVNHLDVGRRRRVLVAAHDHEQRDGDDQRHHLQRQLVEQALHSAALGASPGGGATSAAVSTLPSSASGISLPTAGIWPDSVGGRLPAFLRFSFWNRPSSALRRVAPSRSRAMLPPKQSEMVPRSSETTTTTASVSSVTPMAARWRVPSALSSPALGESGSTAPAVAMRRLLMITAPSWSLFS